MIIVILTLIILVLACVIFSMHHKHIKMLDRLDLMLDMAIENNFSESEFTESRLSKTETNMCRYLSAGKTSFLQVNAEKNSIKSLIADISHQTKTPIANILLYSELLCDSAELNENTKKICEEYKDMLPEKYFAQLIHAVFEKREIISRIYGVDGIAMDKLEIYDGKFDKEKFKSGKYIIVSSFTNEGEGHYYDVGDKVTIDFGNGKTKEYEVMAIGDVTYALSPQFSNMLDIYFTMYSDEFIAETGEENALNIAFNANDDEYASVEKQVKNYCENINADLDFKSRSTYEDSFHNAQKMYLIIGSILSFILGLIGLLNFINSMITSISARQHELAVLQSIGMTGQQLKKMLICEGCLYAAASIIFTLTIGIPISYILVMAISNQMWFFTYHFIVMPSVYSFAALVAISALIPLVCYNHMCKTSIVNRLRISE